MLRDLDDTLWHQVPDTFDHVGPTDIRFYDRYWFAIYEPNGAIGMNVGMGLFNNQNVVDGAATAITNGCQYSFLASRALRPDFHSGVGPLEVKVVEPLRELRLVLGDNPSKLRFDLLWRATWDAREEKPQFTRINGRVTQNTRRFDQLGQVDGWVEAAGTRIEAKDWFGGRDHSWGARDGVAGAQFPRPVTAGSGYAVWFIWTTPTYAGNLSFSWRDGATQTMTGSVAHRVEGSEEHEEITRVTNIEVQMYDGTKRFRTAKIDVELASGRGVRFEATELVRAFAMTGVGYGGFRDRLGHGVWRGEYYEEANEWDVSHPEDVVLESGEIERPWHRDAGALITMDGEQGLGHLMLMAM